MRRFVVLAALVSLTMGGLSCGSKKSSTGPTAPGTGSAEYAVMSMIMSFGEGGLAKRASSQYITAVASVFKNPGTTANVDDWPPQQATNVRLIGAREIPLQEMGFGGFFSYYLPEDQQLTPGETYQLRMTVEGRTFTSKKAARVMEPLRITTADHQHIDVGQSFTVQWTPVAHAAGYAVSVSRWNWDDWDDWNDDPAQETLLLVGTATQKLLPGSLFMEDGEYDISVIAYDESMAPHISKWEEWDQDIPLVYEFDDPKILGIFFGMSSDDIYLYVGEAGEDWDDWDDWDDDHGDNGEIGQIEIAVSPGITPQFSWEGGNALSVIVTDENTGSLIWGITNPIGGIPSPVTYGTVPSGAMQVMAPTPFPLAAGVSYQVTVMATSGEFGVKFFTP